MPREIKTTLAVDGEQAFKRAINEANTSIRNMGTQLTLAAAQFKKDGDAMKLVETRSKALKGEISQQAEIVKALEGAVNDSAKAFGENSEKTEKWEAELNRAKAKLVNLQSELTLNEAGLDRNGSAFDDASEKAADYQATLQTIGKGVSFEAIDSGLKNITGGMEAAAKKVINFARQIREGLVDAATWADDLITDSVKYGKDFDVETLQRWRNAADLIDTPVETIINARDKLKEKIAHGWSEGSGNEKIDIWEFLGIDMSEQRPAMDVLFELGETLRSMESIDGNDIRADTYAMQAFGKSYKDLKPLFEAGREEWEKTVAEQRVVSESHVKALGEMDDANQNLENSWDTLKYSVLAEIAPTLTEATNALTGLLNEFSDWMETDEGKQAMDDLSASLKELFSGLTNIQFKDVVETAGKAIDGIVDGLRWLANHKDGIYTALQVIGAGFAMIKVAELAATIGKIKTGLSGLFGGGNGGGSQAVTTTASGGGSLFSGLAAFGSRIASGAMNLAGYVGNSAGPYMDMFLNQTDLGRFLTGNETWDDVMKAASDYGASVRKNAETFSEDWANNEIIKFWNRGVQTTGANAISLWNSIFGGGDKKVAVREEVEDEMLDEGGMLLSRADRLAAEAYWDALRNDPNGEGTEISKAYQNMWTHFNGSEDDRQMFRTLVDMIDSLKEFGWQADDLPEGWFEEMDDAADLIGSAVKDALYNTGSGTTGGEQLTSQDISGFKQIPAQIMAQARAGVADGISGIRVTIDGYTAGRILAPYVSAEIARNAV